MSAMPRCKEIIQHGRKGLAISEFKFCRPFLSFEIVSLKKIFIKILTCLQLPNQTCWGARREKRCTSCVIFQACMFIQMTAIDGQFVKV